MRSRPLTQWHLTASWLGGQEELVGKIANRLGLNDMWFVRWHLPEVMYPGARYR